MGRRGYKMSLRLGFFTTELAFFTTELTEKSLRATE
jgi:hypothetical protein